jgi:hypothetical protein
MTEAYTFQTHLNVVASKRSTDSVMTSHHVQVRKQGVVYCASIIDYVTMPSGIELWKVNCTSPEVFIGYVTPTNVRACGDDKCGCVAQSEDGASGLPPPGLALRVTPNFCQAGVVAPPDSPNFGNLAINPKV